MQSQKDFNAYIGDKVRSISTLFGTRVTRNETVVDDEYNYIRPYTKTITAEVSAAVFSSAENQPLDYVVKYFYPDKKQISGANTKAAITGGRTANLERGQADH